MKLELPGKASYEKSMDFIANIKNRLPNNPGILGREKYFNTSVLIPLCIINGEYNFIFQKRAAKISQGGEICFPGGKYDPTIDKDSTETALREATEETGIPREHIQIINRTDSLVAPMGAIVDGVVAVVSEAGIKMLKPGSTEVELQFTIPVSFFINNPPEKYKVRLEIQPSYYDEKLHQKINCLPSEELGLPEKYNSPWGGRLYPVYVYKTPYGIIWGITAELVRYVVSKITDDSSDN